MLSVRQCRSTGHDRFPAIPRPMGDPTIMPPWCWWTRTELFAGFIAMRITACGPAWLTIWHTPESCAEHAQEQENRLMTRREMNKALSLAAFSAAGLTELLHAANAGAAQGGKKDGDSIGVQRLFAQTVPDIGGKEVRMVLLTVPPGGTSRPHRHTGPVFAYVLEGSIQNQ